MKIPEQPPKGARYFHEGLYYKKGEHDFVYMWCDKSWTRSSKYWSDITSGRSC